MRDGRSYCCDGLSHLFDFQVNGLGVGEPGDGGRPSVLAAAKRRAAGSARQSRGAARRKAARGHSDRKPLGPEAVLARRAGPGRRHAHVPVELIVNGEAVEQKTIEADGNVHEVAFDYTPQRSSWVAVRIFPAAHTNPVFVEVDVSRSAAPQRPVVLGSRSTVAGRRSRPSSAKASARRRGRRTTTPGRSIGRSRASRSTTAN